MPNRVRLSIVGALLALVVASAHASAGVPAPARWIVFSATPKGTVGAAQLFRVRTTGKGLRQITTGKLTATAPDFSPEGTRLVFHRLGSGLFRMNLDGTGLRRLTSGDRDSQPVWSPDGKRVAFLRPYRAQWRVYVMSASGGVQRRLPKAPPAGRPSWTAKGEAILIPSGADLIKIHSQTGKVLQYLGLTLDIQTAQTATVSPDRRTIAYIGPRLSTGPPDCGEGRCPQYALYLAGIPPPHRPHRVVNDTGPAGWSPDGKRLVFVHQGTLTLWTVGSGKRTTIATKPHIAAGDSPPAWQPR